MVGHAGWIVFLGAALSLAVAPGPAVLFIVARSINQGRRAGIVSVLGMATGSLIHVAAAAVGLSAVLMASAVAFSVVKYAGALYLIGLGIKTILGGGESSPARSTDDDVRSLSTIFRQAFLVNILNPKTALFFLAFLPQFVETGVLSAGVQIALLGTVFVVVALITDSVYALVSGTAGRKLIAKSGIAGRFRYVSGGIYIALGVGTAVGELKR